ncbi:hypothetical protein E8E15_005277 [Penicillium rubens]|nr:hypothetical protein E8E15_005277 [Penicillium rubens]
MFDIFDEPLASRVTNWINERPYPEGLMHTFGLFGSSYVFPTNPQALADVLSMHAYDYVKPTGFKRYTVRFWGHGIVSQEQEEHKQHRKTYLPVFSQQNVSRLKGILSRKSMQFVDHIADLCTQEQSWDPSCTPTAVVNITETVAKVSLDVTGIISLGVDFETILGNHQEVFKAHEMLFTSTSEKKLLFLLFDIMPPWLLNILPSQVTKRLDGAHETLVKVKLRQELAQARNGRETIDEKVYEKLPLLNAVVMEVTRLYPAFSLLLRKAIRETTINGRIIPRGTYVGLCPHAINYAEHLWGPDADKFKPDRWISESDLSSPDQSGGAPSPICMFSFFYGARSCVGRALALAQMKRQLAVLVERYHLLRVDEKYDPRPSGLFATSPPHDLQIKFTKISG